MAKAASKSKSAPVLKWVSEPGATPPMFYELRDGKKAVATVRRITGQWILRDGKPARYQHHYQFVCRWVGGVGHAVGPVFKSVAAAKRAALAAVSA